MADPLDGVRVIELANYLAAPACAALMADMGASIVKVEPPDGDVYRGHRTMRAGDPISYALAVDNRGKRSMTLDLDQPRARGRTRTTCSASTASRPPKSRRWRRANCSAEPGRA